MVINNKSKVKELKIAAAIIGQAIHTDLPLVGFFGRKLSKADNKASTAALEILSAAFLTFLPASLAISFAFLPASLAAFTALFATSPTLFFASSTGLKSKWLYLISSFFTSPVFISSELGAKCSKLKYQYQLDIKLIFKTYLYQNYERLLSCIYHRYNILIT